MTFKAYISNYCTITRVNH